MTAQGTKKNSRQKKPAKSARKKPAGRNTPFEGALLLNALPHPILLIDGEKNIVYANAAAETFFQTGAAFLCRQKLADIIAFGSPLLALVDQVMRKGWTLNEYEIDLGTPLIGSQKQVDVYAGPFPESPNFTLIMLQQRSMANMIERQLTHRAAARSVSGMAAILAHEIKNPLSGIRGAAQLLEGTLNDEDRKLTRLICIETDRICSLVDRMEVFGDERPMSLEPVNIHDVLDHVKQVSINGFAKNLTISENYDPSLPEIPGNRDKLIQAFLNLTKNAAEAISAEQGDGHIILSTAFRPGMRLSLPGSPARVSLPLEITIEDNGPGISEDIKSHLFEPFVTTKQQGTGLGLALVAKIINDHGGVIEYEAYPNRTLFRVLMPRQDASMRKQ